MISSRYKFIFLHVPKTAGNAVQTYLLPFSDDRKVVGAQQDGVERFGIAGALTPTKHAPLQPYAAALGPALETYRVMLPIRDPLDRALSLYFSPHRGAGRPVGFVPAFRLEAFAELLREVPSMADFVRVDGTIRRPDFLLRFDHLQGDLANAADKLGLPPPSLPVLNRSLDQEGRRATLKRDPQIAEVVLQRFAEDYALFGFPLPRTG